MNPSHIGWDVSCTECGTSLRGMLSDDVVGVEVDFRGECRDEVFCSQEHAAAWLAKPLPPVERSEPAPVVVAGLDWVGVLLVAGIVVFCALAVFGAVAVVWLLVR